MANYLAEEAAVLVAQLLIRGHVGCPERRSEVCRRLGNEKCVLRGRQEANRRSSVRSNYVRHRFKIIVIQARKPVHNLVGDSCKREVMLRDSCATKVQVQEHSHCGVRWPLKPRLPFHALSTSFHSFNLLPLSGQFDLNTVFSIRGSFAQSGEPLKVHEVSNIISLAEYIAISSGASISSNLTPLANICSIVSSWRPVLSSPFAVYLLLRCDLLFRRIKTKKKKYDCFRRGTID
jgi:hypothetical protein